MKKSAWPIVAILAVFALGFVSALAVRRPATVEVNTGPSAATTIMLFLLVVLGVLVIAPIGGFLVVSAIRAYQQTKQMEQAVMLFGAKSNPNPAPRRPAVQTGSGGGYPVIIVGGQPSPHVEDWRDG